MSPYLACSLVHALWYSSTLEKLNLTFGQRALTNSNNVMCQASFFQRARWIHVFLFQKWCWFGARISVCGAFLLVNLVCKSSLRMRRKCLIHMMHLALCNPGAEALCRSYAHNGWLLCRAAAGNLGKSQPITSVIYRSAKDHLSALLPGNMKCCANRSNVIFRLFMQFWIAVSYWALHFKWRTASFSRFGLRIFISLSVSIIHWWMQQVYSWA